MGAGEGGEGEGGSTWLIFRGDMSFLCRLYRGRVTRAHSDFFENLLCTPANSQLLLVRV